MEPINSKESRQPQMGDEFKSTHVGADKAQYKPEGYVAMVYAPEHKIESQSDMNSVPQDKLQHAYSLWVMVREQVYQNKKVKAYDEQDLQKVTSFESVSKTNCDHLQVQQFWLVYQHLRRPTAMPYGTTLHFFKSHIKPVWEDENLKKGCRLQFISEKHRTSKFWEDLILAVIGEQLGEKSETVAGIVLNLKPQFDKIAIWLTNCDDEEEISKVKTQLVELLAVEEAGLEYQVFHDSEAQPNKDGSNRGRGGWNRGGATDRGRGTRGGNRGGFVRNERGRGSGNFYRADLAKEEGKDE